MKKILPLFLLISPLTFASEVQIEKLVAPKGYILSNDLQAKQCPNIWSKQIGVFMGNNSHITNPNLILVGQEIHVQNCISKEMVEEKKEEKVQEKTVVSKMEESVVDERTDKKDSKLFLLGSYLNQQTERKGDDQRKSSEGYKIEIGKYFDVGEEQIKISLGYSKINTVYKNQLFGTETKRPNSFLHLESSYLFNLKPNHQIGPNLGLVYHPLSNSAEMKDFKNRKKDSQLSPNLGLNYVFSLNDHWKLDVKVSNRVEQRINTWSSIGVEYNF